MIIPKLQPTGATLPVFPRVQSRQAAPPAEQERSGPGERSLVEYDEDRELTRYVWDHYHRFLTKFEWRVGRLIIGRAKAAGSLSHQMAEAMNRLWGSVDEPDVAAALADGPEAFRRRVRDRLLSEHPAEVFINRCPRCGCVVRTPGARQCFWCGFDWHG